MLDVSSSNRAMGIAQSRAASNRASARHRAPVRRRSTYHPPARRSYSSSRGSGYHGGTTRTYRGGSTRHYGYSTTRRSRPAGPPPKPKYSGPPPPSAQMIQQLYGQLGEIGRQGKEYKADYTRSRAGLGSARQLFLKQLADTYKQRQTETAASFAERGLSQSGLLNEAVAQLGKQRAGEQSSYQADYQGRLDQLLSQFTRQRADLSRRRRTLSDRYNSARADRARILKLMGA
jgi:hypothetical protein